ncbi:MAG: shikimate dehydrogenase [Acidimicrobiia bacterium]|nr:shikimate dehydrogenase [Acidimicrobiia bacterium]
MRGRVALIGNPLKRKHSAVMHNAAFAAHGIDATYELRPIEPGDLGPFFSEARQPDWLGFGVTAPYKQAAMVHLDEIEPGAMAIGAVNNGLRRDDGSLVGFNTDASGFIAAVESTGTAVAGRSAVVVGAGGAARAVVWALLDAGVESVFVANRTPGRARELAESLSPYGAVVPGSLDDPSMAHALASAAIAVNATTVGMTTDTVALDVAVLPDDALVFDLVYVPPDTPLVRAATARGLKVCNGMEMLVRQAEIAFQRWTGIGSTADVMRSAVEAWLPHSETER